MNILIIIGAVIVVSILLSLGQGWSSVLNSDRNNLVFENKNHNYGAYQLRRSYDRRLAMSMLLVVFITTGAAIATNKLSSKNVPTREVKVDFDIPPIIVDAVSTDVVVIKPQIEKPRTDQTPASLPPSGSNSGTGIIEVVEDLWVTPLPIITPGNPTLPITGETPGTGPVGGGPGGGDAGALLGGDETNNEIVSFAQFMPEYPGGDEQLLKDVYSFVNYPEMAREKNKEGLVNVAFVIEKDGSVSDVRALKDIPGAIELSREAERCVKKLKRFKPGRVGDHAVRVRTVLPIHFKLK
jgi:periplasmic protein TonB